MANKKNSSRQIRLLNKFIKIFFLSFAVFIIVAALGTVAYIQVASSNIEKALKNNPILAGDSLESIEDGMSREEASPLLDKKITSFAVYGVDEDGYRTDVNMMVFFHHNTGVIDIVSIPRDTMIRIPDKLFAEISQQSNNAQQHTRINAVPAWIGSKTRNEKSVEVLESVFGVDIDYYVTMNLAGFKDIVDAVGPIMFEVPMDMDYVDLEQGENGLTIKLDAGMQEIWGPQAESLIRFRSGYPDADLGRIKTQHEFMKAFVETVLSTKNRFNMLSLLETILVDVTTDFTEAVDYLIFLKDVSPDKVNFYTLPGAGGAGGVYEYDLEGTKELLQEILNREDDVLVDADDNDETVDNSENGDLIDNDVTDGTVTDNNDTTQTPGIVVEPVEILDAKDFTISVLNGTYISGLAGRTQAMLIEEGYNIVEADNYPDKPIEKSIITAPAREIAEQLSQYFRSPEIIVDETLMDADIQVIIAIGTLDSDQE